MKKLFLSLLLMLPLCGFAQKGMQGIGFGIECGIGFDYPLTSYGATFKYEYNWTDNVRLATSLCVMNIGGIIVSDHDYAKKSTTAIFGLEVHRFLNDVRPFRPYLLYGANYGYSFLIDTTMGIKVGLGFNWRLSYNYSLQIELPIRWLSLGHYDYHRYYSGFCPSINYIYTF